MLSPINTRIQKLRDNFPEYHIKGFIIPSSDPHLSEYTASHWQTREWISGFTGSAGTIIVLTNKSGLWTDSRYFIQAKEQLSNSEIVLYKENIANVPTINEYLLSNLNNGDSIGIDNRLFSAAQVLLLEKELSIKNIHIINCIDIIDHIWADRPPISKTNIFIYDKQYAGQDICEKIKAIRDEIKKAKSDALLVSALDEIAWTLNIRGTDISYNPVVTSFLFISNSEIHLYIDPEKLTKEIRDYFANHDIKIFPYEQIYNDLCALPDISVFTDINQVNDALFKSLGRRAIPYISPISLLKAIRNKTEIKGIHQCMIKDGIALVRFLIWLQQSITTREETEISVAAQLHRFRSEQPLFMDDSFATIAGYDKHAAIVHYEATPETNISIQPKGFLLLDSGAQYLDGTTDITRTIALGPLTEEEKIDYTLILKGHIDLALSIFPAGTTGGQLDAFARMPIWQHHKNYLHGTGHGVGHFLNVHEGPQSIRMQQKNVPLQPGMVTSNEPGIYMEEKYGVRIENLTLVCNDGSGLFGDYYKFETLTLCPISKEPICKELLTDKEIEWFNNYHQKVYQLVSPHLSQKEKEWLKTATSKI